MNAKELEDLGINQEWINEDPEHRIHVEFLKKDLVKTVIQIGGLEALHHLLLAGYHAWNMADSLIRIIDKLFYIEDEATYNKTYNQLIQTVIEDTITALENAECHINYEDDPMNEAENTLKAMMYDLIDRFDRVTDRK